MKVAMQGKSNIAGNSSVDNVLSGQRYERSPWPSVGTLYVNGSAAGLMAELNVGGISVTPPVVCNIANVVPVVPDHMLVDGWECLPNALIQLTITNTTSGTLSAYWRIDLQEVAVPGYNA